MANIIKIKRKPLANGAGVPNNLSAGELAFSEADAKLFYGLDNAGSVSPIEIAGSGYVLAQISNNAPTKTGSGATGTWNISVTGNAGTVTNGVYTSRNITAGSGLAGGGTLANDITINIGSGDGISVAADSIAVDSTVVRTSTAQTVNGVKTFGNNTVFSSGITSSGTNSLQAAATASAATQFAVFTSSPASSAQSVLTRTPSEVKSDIGLNNVTNNAQVKKISSSTNGYVPTWDGTTGDLLATGYSVETTLTGGAGALPRADAVKTYVDNLLSTNDAMVFKGTIGSGGTVTSLPTTHSAGWTYRVITAGTYAGKVCEVGDLLIAVVDRTGSSNTNDDWTVAQTNIDGSVVGPASATANNFALFDGTTGKLIKDAGFGSGIFAVSSHSHGNITSVGAIGSTANLPIITTTNGVLTTGSFGTTANTFCQGNDSRLSDTRNTTNTLTVNNGGAGDASSFTFNGSVARTISYNSIGAPSINGVNAVGTWNISVTGNAGTVTNGVYTTGSYSDPSWITSLAKSKVGLGNVENTALSTWAGSTNLTTLGTVATGVWSATTISVNKGGTGQTEYTNGQLLIGNSTGSTLTKATLTQGTGVVITNGAGSITIAHNDTSTLNGMQGGNGISSITVDDFGHVTAIGTATYLTSESLCSAISDCTIDGGTF